MIVDRNKRLDINEIKKEKQIFITNKVEYDEILNEIWLFGTTIQFHPILIRINTFSNLFYIEVSQLLSTEEQSNKSNELMTILKPLFHPILPTITISAQNNKTLFQIQLNNASLSSQKISNQMNNFENNNQVFDNGFAKLFIPKTNDQFIIIHNINPYLIQEISLDDQNNILLDGNYCINVSDVHNSLSNLSAQDNTNNCCKNTLKNIKNEQDTKCLDDNEQKINEQNGNQVQKLSICQIEIKSNKFEPIKYNNKSISSSIQNNLIILVTDIENIVIQSGFDAETQQSSKKQIFTTSQKMELAEDIDIRYYDNELEMLIGWNKELNLIDPDVITGFNVLKFDLNFIYLRAYHLIQTTQSPYSHLNFGRVPSRSFNPQYATDLFQNSKYFYLPELNDPLGRMVIDGSWYFNQTHPYTPLTQRKLSDWAKKYLNQDTQKLEIGYKDFADYLYSDEISKRSKLGEYNIRDSEIVQELFIKFDFIKHYSDLGFVHECLTHQYHDKNLFPKYWSQINSIKQYKQTIQIKDGCLTLKGHSPDEWNQIQSFISNLEKLPKLLVSLDSNTQPLIFKQLVKIQDNLKTEEIIFNLNEGTQNLQFKLNSLIQVLDKSLTKVVKIELNKESKDQEIDLIESLIHLPNSLKFFYLNLYQQTKPIKSFDSQKLQDNMKILKATNLSKIVLRLNDYSEEHLDFMYSFGQFLLSQQELETIDLNIVYNEQNIEFIQNVVRLIVSNSKQLKILFLNIKGTNETKTTDNIQSQKNATSLIESIIKIFEKELDQIQKIFFSFYDIKLFSFNDNIFTSFGSNLQTLKYISFKVDDEKKYLKSHFYDMIKLLKTRI